MLILTGHGQSERQMLRIEKVKGLIRQPTTLNICYCYSKMFEALDTGSLPLMIRSIIRYFPIYMNTSWCMIILFNLIE